MTSGQRKLRIRKRKADANVARAQRAVKALTRRLRGATKTLTKRQAARKKIK
jgi:multidrug resistance efflux pump